MTVLGADGVFSPNRIQKSTLPEEFFRYELSSGKDQRFGAITTGRASRYAGDFISKTPLKIFGQISKLSGKAAKGFFGGLCSAFKMFSKK